MTATKKCKLDLHATFWRQNISPAEKKVEMSSEVHARTRSSERLDGPPGGAGSTSPPTTTTSGAAAATATGGGGGSSATANNNASQHHHPSKAQKSSNASSMLQFSEHAINQVQGLSKRGLDLPITARLQRRRYRWDFLLFFCLFLSSRRRAVVNIIARFCRDVYIDIYPFVDMMMQ